MNVPLTPTDVEKLNEIAFRPKQSWVGLTQPEPVAWGVFDGPNLHDMFFSEEEAQDLARLKGDGSVVKPFYAAPRPWVES